MVTTTCPIQEGSSLEARGTTLSSGRRRGTLGRWRLRPLWSREGRYRSLHPVSGAGSRAFRDHRKLYRPWRDRDRAYHDGYRRLPIHGH
jgi:hypothetical protein